MADSDMRFGAKTDSGLIRTRNEDAMGAVEDAGLWFIADGMGGHEDGQLASRLAAQRLQSAVMEGADLPAAIRAAHDAIVTAARNGEGSPTMGCTVVALRSTGPRYEIAWVGDSRAYLWDGGLYQLTRDHSVQQEYLDRVGADAEPLEPGARSKAITRCLGLPNGGIPRVDILSGRWRPGDKVLLCSDGLSDELTDQGIEDILAAHWGDTDQATVEALVEAARRAGGRDNITVMLISAPEKTGEDTLPGTTPGRGAWTLGIGVAGACLLGLAAYLLLVGSA